MQETLLKMAQNQITICNQPRVTLLVLSKQQFLLSMNNKPLSTTKMVRSKVCKTPMTRRCVKAMRIETCHSLMILPLSSGVEKVEKLLVMTQFQLKPLLVLSKK